MISVCIVGRIVGIVLLLPAQSYAFSQPKLYRPVYCVGNQLRGLHTHTTAYDARKNERKRSQRIPSSLRSQMAASLDSDDSNNKKISQQSTSSTPTSTPSATTPFVGLPSYKRILFFVATTFLIWVSEPLLSLVDSAAVGRYAGKTIPTSGSKDGSSLSSVVQLAALGPATTICDSSIYLTMFISMATTNKLAKAFARKDVPDQIQTLSHVLGVSLAVGSLLVLFINFQGEGLLSAILGPAGATATIGKEVVDLTPSVLHASMGYTRIRSIVAPLAVMGMTSQAALLCSQDTKTPALAVLVASITNCIGDYFFVAKMGWGVRGAALATSMASLLANGMLITKVYRMMKGWKDEYRDNMQRGMVQKKLQPSASDLLKNEEKKDPTNIPFISFPDRESLVSLLLLVGPLFFVMLGKILGYSAMTVQAGTYGMVSLACHNVLMRIFFFFATVGDALSQSAQTFLPGLFYQKKLQDERAAEEVNDAITSDTLTTAKSDNNNARTLLKRLVLISSIGGLVNCVLGRNIARGSGGTFTSNSALVSLMTNVSPFMGLALLLHPLTMALEGSIIAANDAPYLVGTYIASLIVLLGQLKFIAKDFMGVWHGILVFQLIRITQFGARVWKRTASSKVKER